MDTVNRKLVKLGHEAYSRIICSAFNIDQTSSDKPTTFLMLCYMLWRGFHVSCSSLIKLTPRLTQNTIRVNAPHLWRYLSPFFIIFTSVIRLLGKGPVSCQIAVSICWSLLFLTHPTTSADDLPIPMVDRQLKFISWSRQTSGTFATPTKNMYAFQEVQTAALQVLARVISHSRVVMNINTFQNIEPSNKSIYYRTLSENKKTGVTKYCIPNNYIPFAK